MIIILVMVYRVFGDQYDQIVIIINFLIGRKKVESLCNWAQNIFFVSFFVQNYQRSTQKISAF